MNLAATLSLNTQGFTAPLAGAMNAVHGATEGMRKAFEGVQHALGLLGVSFAAFKSAEAFTEHLKGIFETGKELKTLSAISGQSVQDLVVLKKAFTEAGIGDSLETNMIRLQKALGGVNEEGEPTVFMFQKLGLNIAELKNMSAIEQFQRVSGAIGKLSTQSDRAASAMAIFGRQGASMLALDPKEIDEAQKSMAAYGGIMQKNAALFTSITNVLETLGGKVKGFFAGFADQVGPVLLPLLEKLKSISLIGLGEQIGGVVAKLGGAFAALTAAFKSGNLGELLWLSFQLAVNKLANGLIGVATGFLSAIGAGWDAQFNTIAGFFQNLGSAWEGVKDGLSSAFQAAGAVLLEVFQKPIRMMQSGLEYAIQQSMGAVAKVPGLNKLMGLENFQPQSFKEIDQRNQKNGGATLFGYDSADLAQKADENAAKAKVAFANLYKAMDIDQGMKNIILAFQEGMKNGMNALDVSTVEAQFKAKMAEIQKLIPEAVTDASGEKAGAGAAAAAAGNGGYKAEGDRLSKIGLFVGQGGPANEHARRTADNTGKQVQLTTRMIDLLNNIVSAVTTSTTGVAVFGI